MLLRDEPFILSLRDPLDTPPRWVYTVGQESPWTCGPVHFCRYFVPIPMSLAQDGF